MTWASWLVCQRLSNCGWMVLWLTLLSQPRLEHSKPCRPFRSPSVVSREPSPPRLAFWLAWIACGCTKTPWQEPFLPKLETCLEWWTSISKEIYWWAPCHKRFATTTDLWVYRLNSEVTATLLKSFAPAVHAAVVMPVATLLKDVSPEYDVNTNRCVPVWSCACLFVSCPLPGREEI